MKSILGIGNALTDILAILPDDSLLKEYHLPLGSMQHVDMETGDRIWNALKEIGVKYVPGGSAANTITCTSIFGMPSGYIGKIGDDELGQLFKSTMEQFGVRYELLRVRTADMGSTYQLTYRISLPQGGRTRELVDAIRTENGNLPVSIGHMQSEQGM